MVSHYFRFACMYLFFHFLGYILPFTPLAHDNIDKYISLSSLFLHFLTFSSITLLKWLNSYWLWENLGYSLKYSENSLCLSANVLALNFGRLLYIGAHCFMCQIQTLAQAHSAFVAMAVGCFLVSKETVFNLKL